MIFKQIINILIVAAPYGLIYGIMALGVFITFRILDFPDLTVDGSFPLGAAIMALFIVNGFNLYIALFISFLGGITAGIITASIHNYIKVPGLLAGIITMIMLYSINIRILGGSNLQILKRKTILTNIIDLFNKTNIPEELILIIFFIIIVIIIKLLLDLFFHTDLGLTLRAMGDNTQMVLNQGINPDILKLIGVGMSNGIVALSGAFFAQYQKFADTNLGQGIIITGLASVIIGEFIIRSNKIFLITLSVVLGATIIQTVEITGRMYGAYVFLKPTDLKLIKGFLLIVILGISIILKQRKKTNKKIRTGLTL